MKTRKRKPVKRPRSRRNKRVGMAERLNRIAKECAAMMKEPYRSIDIDEMLYDEMGLPK